MCRVLFAAIAVFTLIQAQFVAQAQTVYTGDKIQGHPVISKLDAADLEKGKTHYFLFQGVEMGSGQHWYVPVVVVKGVKDGKKLLLTSGVHGDELSPVAVLHQTLNALDPQKLSGTVIGIMDISRASVEKIQRKWPVSDSGGYVSDMNRVWPGREFGSAPERQAWLVWEKLIVGNADIALDFHTASTGQDFAWLVFADYRNADAKRMAELFPVDVIKNDPGLSGTLETALVKAGIPAITVEVGGARYFDTKLIKAAVEGVENVLADYGLSGQKVGRTAKDTHVFVGNKMDVIRARTGGYVDMLVDLGSTVAVGQKIAVQRDFFGKVVHEYTAGTAGQVSIIARDALREPGAHLATILGNDPGCKDDACAYDSSELGQ